MKLKPKPRAKPRAPKDYPDKFMAAMNTLANTLKKPRGPTPEEEAIVDATQRQSFRTLGYRLVSVGPDMAAWHGCRTGLDFFVERTRPVTVVDAHEIAVRHEIDRLRKAVRSLADNW